MKLAEMLKTLLSTLLFASCHYHSGGGVLAAGGFAVDGLTGGGVPC